MLSNAHDEDKCVSFKFHSLAHQGAPERQGHQSWDCVRTFEFESLINKISSLRIETHIYEQESANKVLLLTEQYLILNANQRPRMRVTLILAGKLLGYIITFF